MYSTILIIQYMIVFMYDSIYLLALNVKETDTSQNHVDHLWCVEHVIEAVT
jgi:hypothetical protein